MKGLVLLLARELRRRLPVQLACAASGIFVLALPWLPGVKAPLPDALRGVGAVCVAALWLLLLTLLEGMGFLSADLRERRLGFDFRLPVAATAIWVSRFGAVAATLLMAVLLNVGIPGAAGADIGGGLLGLEQMVFGSSGIRLSHPVLATTGIILAILLLANAVALALASRSARVAVDLSVLVACGLAGGASATSLWRYFATRSAGSAIELSLAAATLALLVASGCQLTRGRTEPDRAHASFTRALATIGVAGFAAIALWSHWLLSPEPQALDRPPMIARPLARDLVWVGGSVRSRQLIFTFLVDPFTGRNVRLHQPAFDGSFHSRAHASADGATVAWTEVERTGGEVFQQRLRFRNRPFDGPAIDSPISWSVLRRREWALSPDGALVASLADWISSEGRSHLVVDELRSGSTVRDIAIPACASAVRSLQVLSRSRVLVSCGCSHPGDDTPLGTVLDVDMATGSARLLQEPPRCGTPADGRLASSADGFFEPAPQGPGDPRRAVGRVTRGAEAIELDYPPDLADGKAPHSARFLEDGRLATLWSVERAALVVLYERSGRIAFRTTLPTHFGEILAGLDDGAIALFEPSFPRSMSRPILGRVVRLDPQTGRIGELAGELEPLRPDSAAIPTTLFADEEGRLFWLDLRTGSIEPLFSRV